MKCNAHTDDDNIPHSTHAHRDITTISTDNTRTTSDCSHSPDLGARPHLRVSRGSWRHPTHWRGERGQPIVQGRGAGRTNAWGPGASLYS